MNLEERFYTSTEVAEILGVSLRSVYRYLEEGKLDAEVKTATGRHRFTKENILDFLYPNKVSASSYVDKDVTDEQSSNFTTRRETKLPKSEISTTSYPQQEKVDIKTAIEVEEPAIEERKEEPKDEEPVDWLAKFREAADKFKSEPEKAEVSTLSFDPQEGQEKQEEETISKPSFDNSATLTYYRSSLTGLKDIAQNIDKSARKASVDYAFTMSAGLSLHKPIKPFSVLHVYVRSEDKDFFEKVLYLTPSDRGNSQLCLIVDDDDNLYKSTKEMHSLRVVSDIQLRKDLMQYGEEELAKELDAVSR